MNADGLSRIAMSSGLADSLSRATDYARAQGHAEVALEHMLLALCDDPDAGLVLAASNVNVAELSAEVSRHLSVLPMRPQGQEGELSVAEDLRRILEAAAAAARGGRRREINGAIVLAAIVGEGKSAAAHVLSSLGLTFEGAIRALQAKAAPAPAQPPAADAESILANARERVQVRSLRSRIERAQDQPPPDEATRTDDSRLAGREPPPPETLHPKPFYNRPPQPEPAPPAPEEAYEPQAPEPPGPAFDELAPQGGYGPETYEPEAYEQQPYEQQGYERPAYEPQPYSPAPREAAPFNEPSLDLGPPPMPASPPYPPPIPAPGQIEGWATAPTAPPTGRSLGPAPPPIPYPAAAPAPPHPGQQAPVPWSQEPMLPTPTLPPGVGAGRAAQAPPPPTLQRQPLPGAPGMSAPAAPRRGAARAEIGQLVENIPRSMRVAVPALIEVRIARADVKALAEGLQGGGAAYQHEVTVTKAMSVRLRAPDGGFYIETASPETQWIEKTMLISQDDFASWRWHVTPRATGRKRLQLVISARTVSGDGLAAETALPDQVITVRVRTNYAQSASHVIGWGVAAVIGGLLAKFGEGAFNLLGRVLH